MLTGTPLDLTVIPELLRWAGVAVPVVWLGVLLAALVLAWGRTRTRLGRTVTIAAVLLVLLVLPSWGLNSLRRQALAQQAQAEAAQQEFLERRAVAEALFQKRCETAGEFIYKAVPDLKSLVWMKWRPKEINLSDQFDMNDPFGRDCGGEECLKELLVATEGAELRFRGEPWGHGNMGYEFIESLDPVDGKLYRYRLRLYRLRDRDPQAVESAIRSELFKEPITATTAAFGITWEDLSTREDRENWIAGGSVSVVDLKTNEVAAKRIGYMMDKGLGNESGFRSPWGLETHGNTCPPKLDEAGKKTMVGFTRRFLFKVARPTQEERP